MNTILCCCWLLVMVVVVAVVVVLNVVIFQLGDAAQSTSRDLWMEVMLKLVTVAIVQAWPQHVVCIQRVLGVSGQKSTVQCRPLQLALLQVFLGIY